ncbi:hypothetical protein [Methylicorpusculum sp.]
MVVQLQNEPHFYNRFFGDIFLYRHKNKPSLIMICFRKDY